MFVGHLALALAAKRAAPRVNLGWLMAGVTALDLVWPIFVIAGVEHVRIVPGATAFTPLILDSYPWSHSLAMAIVWGVVLVGLARGFGVPRSASLLLVGLVVSHWVLDFASHAPDMPLWPGPSPRFGLGLWNSIPATLLVEGTLWAAGIAVYLRGRHFRDVGLGPWSPAPSSPKALGWFALIGWMIIPWAAAADRIKPAAAATAA